MKRKLFPKLLLLAFILIFCITSFADSEASKEQVLSHILLQCLENWHYAPRKINDEFSQRVFNLYIKGLDRSKRFLTKPDVEQLKAYELKIDDQLKAGDTEFFDLSTNLLSKRIQEVQVFSQEILKKPFDFTVDESLETDSEKRDYCDGSAELKEQWRKILKYQTLVRYLDLARADTKENKTQKSIEKISLAKLPFQPKLESQARESLAKNLKRDFQKMLQDNINDELYSFSNAITGSFDPHTEYLPPQLKDEFDIDMSGTLEGIGALLQEEGEYIKIQEIIPGSAAWRQKELKAGDIILKVAEGNGEPVDIVSARVNDAVKLIRGKKGTEVRLTVQKPDGQIVVIPIIRDVVVIEETYAKSAVITNKKLNKKFGYVNLPMFYRDFKSTDARNSSDDVRKELVKLKDEKVNGIVLDLRYNGGGALEDAVKMAGLFIKSGPIVQVKDRDNQGEIRRDPDAGIVYNGPLVVLINSYSASASEIVAAALQDYNRAVIVGSSNSFGKGTVQTFVDLDRFLANNYASYKPLGSLKLTIQKFYRINGESTQNKGVASDIPLPDSTYTETGEKTLDYPLLWDTTDAVPYKKWDTQKYDLGKLKQNSAKRVRANQAFKSISDAIVNYKKEKEHTLQTLKLSSFIEEQEQLKQEAEDIKNLQTEQPDISVSSLKADSGDTKPDSAKNQKTKDWLKQVGSDIYLGESLSILNDMNAQP
jgi:carboxyl-terminal processing protease